MLDAALCPLLELKVNWVALGIMSLNDPEREAA
jgi:hypothetical protein